MFTLALLAAAAAATADPALAEYARIAPGVYSTAGQHAADPRYDIVEAHVTRIWPERTDGVWLYQEQAILNRAGMRPDEARAAPYFQRVARIARTADGGLRRDNYVLTDATAVAGKPEAITPAMLGPAGCHNILERVAAGYWTARTEGCANGYKGAVEMRSQSVQTDTVYANWDRGFDASGAPVWGPADGGYVFVKK
jgi:hypothetical protein